MSVVQKLNKNHTNIHFTFIEYYRDHAHVFRIVKKIICNNKYTICCSLLQRVHFFLENFHYYLVFPNILQRSFLPQSLPSIK